MCKELSTLFNIVNTKTWTFELLRKFYAENEIYHLDSLLINGICAYSSLGVRPKKRFMLFSKEEIIHLMDKKSTVFGEDSLHIASEIKNGTIDEPSHALNKGTYIFPETEGGDVYLSIAMLDMQYDYTVFLNKCIDGYLDIEYLNKCLSKHDHPIINFRPSKNAWKPIFSLEKCMYGYANLEEFVNDTNILKHAFQGEGELFSRIRKCPACGKYFVPKSLKKKFCSDKCRGAYHYAIEH